MSDSAKRLAKLAEFESAHEANETTAILHQIERDIQPIQESVESTQSDIEEIKDGADILVKAINELEDRKADRKEVQTAIDSISRIPGPRGFKGEKGDNYTITDKDYKDIASKVEVPIVEKIVERTEVIKEQPIVKTEIVKETTITEDLSGESIVKRINDLPLDNDKKIDAKHIKGLPLPGSPGHVWQGISEVRALELIRQNAPESSASAFTDLTDTFPDYTGLAGQGLRVNATEDGIDTYTAVDTDEKVKYDAGDPTAGYIADKIIAGPGISVAEGTGANENKLVITNTDKGSDVDLSGYFNKTTDDTDDITDTATNRFTNDTDITRLANTSGTNTGDQDLSSYALTSSLSSYARLDGTNQPFTGNITIDKQEATLTLSSDTDYVNKISFKNNNVEVASFISDQANTTLGFDTTLEDFYINSGARFFLQSGGSNIFYIDNTYARVYKRLGIVGVPQAGVSLDVYGQVMWLGSDSLNNRSANTNKAAYIAVPTYTGGTDKSMFAYIDNYSGNNNIWIGGGAGGYRAATKTSFAGADTPTGTGKVIAEFKTTSEAFLLNTTGAAIKGGVVKGAASQTGNLFEYRDSANTLLGGRSSAGEIFYGTSKLAGVHLSIIGNGTATGVPFNYNTAFLSTSNYGLVMGWNTSKGIISSYGASSGLQFYTHNGSAWGERIGVTTTGEVVINEGGVDADFRIESDGDANNFFSDGGTNRIGIGTGTPGYKLDVVGDINTSTGFRVGGTAPVADGTYAFYNDGVTSGQVTSITTKGGIITAIAVLP